MPRVPPVLKRVKVEEKIAGRINKQEEIRPPQIAGTLPRSETLQRICNCKREHDLSPLGTVETYLSAILAAFVAFHRLRLRSLSLYTSRNASSMRAACCRLTMLLPESGYRRIYQVNILQSGSRL